MVESTLDIRTGNLLDVQEGLIAHQVNLGGVMNAGLAKDIRQKYPEIYPPYQLAIQNRTLSLGDVQIIQVADNLYVGNIVGQGNYGRAKGTCYTHYPALNAAFSQLNWWHQCTNLPVYLPYGIGCKLGGGEWEIVEKLIVECVPSAIVLKLKSN